MRRLIATALSALLLVACAHVAPRPAVQLPALRLAPSALGHEVSLQQQLQFRFGAHERAMDALLEVDAVEVRLAVQALGQTGVRLSWDGQVLQQQRAAWLPETVRAERVLDDLQFVLWPADAIRRALPSTWTLQEEGPRRALVHAGTAWLSVTRIDGLHVQLVNHADGYVLDIRSAANEAPPAEETQP